MRVCVTGERQEWRLALASRSLAVVVGVVGVVVTVVAGVVIAVFAMIATAITKESPSYYELLLLHLRKWYRMCSWKKPVS